MDSRDAPAASEAGVGVRVLLPDGGQMQEPEQEGEEAQEAEDTQDESESDAEEAVEEVDEGDEAAESDGDEDEESAADDEDQPEDGAEDGDDAEAAEDETDEESAEGDEEEGEEETEREKAVSDEGARLLHLNVDGVFLDLLGLEVDLDTVTLDLTAVTGESKLLGNLLSAVSGLLGGDPLGDLLPENPLSGLFGGGEEGEGSGMLPDFSPMERARELAASMADAIKGAVEDAGSSIISALPLEELLAEFLQALVDQLLESADGNGDGDSAEAEEAAASA